MARNKTPKANTRDDRNVETFGSLREANSFVFEGMVNCKYLTLTAATGWTVLEGAAEFPRKRWMEMFSELCLTISGCAWEEAYYVGHQQVR